MVAAVGGARAVAQQHALEAAVVRFAHRRVHADVGGDAGEDQVADTTAMQDELQIGGAERALAGLVDDRLARHRVELGNDVPTRFAAHENAAAGAGVTDARTDAL